MQYIENDMDDLFKRAAENYPLKTGEGDWETIASRLKSVSNETRSVTIFKKDIYKKLLVLVLFFSTLTIGKSALQLPKAGLPSLSIEKIIVSDNKINTDHLKLQDINTSGYTLNHSKKPTTAAFLNRYFSGGQKLVQQSYYPNTGTKKSGTDATQTIQSRQAKNDNDQTLPFLLYEPATALYNVDDVAVYEDLSLSVKNENIQRLNESTKEVITVDKKISQKKDHIELSKKKAFYIGVAAGPDFSKVQSMAFSNSGFSIGLIAGIKLAGKISFETGILWNRKYYNSTGNEFNMDKIKSTMPAGMVINSLEAKSSLIEIPFKIKYDFLNRANATWFATAGISAYIMTTESNKYHVTMNGNTEMVTGIYRNYNYGLPAVASISVGYQKNLSKFINIRIEPFLKIPLQGMGVGNLPITSTGLQFGITRFFK